MATFRTATNAPHAVARLYAIHTCNLLARPRSFVVCPSHGDEFWMPFCPLPCLSHSSLYSVFGPCCILGKICSVCLPLIVM